MPKLSVVIITFNEERNIKRCLASVKDVADDIVVVDSFSTDNTKSICQSFGARVVEHAFGGHISQKNFAITQAKYPHQLSLDADEALTEELKKEVLKVKENWDSDGYRMNRLTNYCGKWIRHGGWYPDPKLRLYDSRKGNWGGMDPHDKFEMENDAKISHLHGDLLHYTYYTVEEHILQVDKFSTIAANTLINKGKHIYFYQVLLNPVAKFLRNYFINRGFLDGYYGFFLCNVAAFQTGLRYFKAWHLQHGQNKKI